MQVYVTPSGGYAPVYASMPAGGELSYIHSFSLWRQALTARCCSCWSDAAATGLSAELLRLRVAGCAAQLAWCSSLVPDSCHLVWLMCASHVCRPRHGTCSVFALANDVRSAAFLLQPQQKCSKWHVGLRPCLTHVKIPSDPVSVSGKC
jgi:hypothetical protein